MHEAAIAEALIFEVRTHVPEGARAVTVRIDVGELEHLDAEVLATIWSAMTLDTELAGSTLETTSVPLRVRCRACGGAHRPEDPAILSCPTCGAVRPDVLEGSGVLLRSIEAEE